MPPQGIDLTHQVTLADTADRRVAAHLPQRVDAVGQEQRARTASGRRQGGFGAGVAAANDDHFIGVCESHGFIVCGAAASLSKALHPMR